MTATGGIQKEFSDQRSKPTLVRLRARWGEWHTGGRATCLSSRAGGAPLRLAPIQHRGLGKQISEPQLRPLEDKACAKLGARVQTGLVCGRGFLCRSNGPKYERARGSYSQSRP